MKQLTTIASLGALTRHARWIAVAVMLTVLLDKPASAQRLDEPMGSRLENALRELTKNVHMSGLGSAAIAVFPPLYLPKGMKDYVVTMGTERISEGIQWMLKGSGWNPLAGADLRKEIAAIGRGSTHFQQPSDVSDLTARLYVEYGLGGSLAIHTESRRATLELTLYKDELAIATVTTDLLSGSEWKSRVAFWDSLTLFEKSTWRLPGAWPAAATGMELLMNEMKSETASAWSRLVPARPPGKVAMMPVWLDDRIGEVSKLSAVVRDELQGLIGIENTVTAQSFDQYLMRKNQNSVWANFFDEPFDSEGRLDGVGSVLFAQIVPIAAGGVRVDLRLDHLGEQPRAGESTSFALPRQSTADRTSAAIAECCLPIKLFDVYPNLSPCDDGVFFTKFMKRIADQFLAEEVADLLKPARPEPTDSTAAVARQEKPIRFAVLPAEVSSDLENRGQLDNYDQHRETVHSLWSELAESRDVVYTEAANAGRPQKDVWKSERVELLGLEFEGGPRAESKIEEYSRKIELTTLGRYSKRLAEQTEAALVLIFPKGSRKAERLAPEVMKSWNLAQSMRHFAYGDRPPSSIPDYFVRAQVHCTKSNVAVTLELLNPKGEIMAASKKPRMVPGIFRSLVIDSLEGKSAELADPPESIFRNPAASTTGDGVNPASQPSSRPTSTPAAPTPAATNPETRS